MKPKLEFSKPSSDMVSLLSQKYTRHAYYCLHLSGKLTMENLLEKYLYQSIVFGLVKFWIYSD